MAKVTTNFKSAKFLKKRLTANDALNIGDATVVAMKDSISKGLSPVLGVGRFERYSEQKGGSYPASVRGRFPGKKTRPVNLYLNGYYLSFLTWWFSRKKKHIGIGFSGKRADKTSVPKFVMDLFEAHNEGMNRNVPQRRHLPSKQGEEFTKTIQAEYKREFNSVIRRHIKKINKEK